jgi:hypothetical protein
MGLALPVPGRMSNEGSTAMRYAAFHASIPVLLLVLAACGGGAPPRELRVPGVEVARQTPVKRVFYEDSGLNLVKAIAPADDGFLVVGNSRICRLSRPGEALGCNDTPVDLWESEVVTDATGAPVAIVGSGGWGRPSAAVLDLTGRLLWKYEGGYDAMGSAAIVDRNGERIVLVEHSQKGLQTFAFKTGETVPSGDPPGRIVASADLDGDGARELLAVPENGMLRITDGSGTEVARLRLNEPWHHPVITNSQPPSIVVSFDERIAVYDGRFRLQKEFSAAGSEFPLHVGAAAFLGTGPGAPFVAVYKGRGGWHKSILYVYAEDGTTIYKEILDGDFPCVAPYGAATDRIAFLLGGRGRVLLYSFDR